MEVEIFIFLFWYLNSELSFANIKDLLRQLMYALASFLLFMVFIYLSVAEEDWP